jgi:virginiamycin B lyase
MKSVFALFALGLFALLPAAPATAIQDFPLPTGDAGLSEANQGPTFGNKGIISWGDQLVFAEEGANQLGFAKTNGEISEVAMPPQVGSPEYGPFALSSDGGSDLWMISAGAPLEGRVTRFNLDDGITYWNLGYTRVVSVAADSQGGAWVTNEYGEGISYFDSENNEHFFDSPEYSDPAPVTVAGDGAAWFGDGSSTIKRITKTGNLQNFHASGDGDIVSLTKGPDGAVWYAKFSPGGGWLGPPASGGIIGRLSLGGSPKVFKTPMEDMTPSSLITGKDGALWFTTRLGEGIGRLTTSGRYSFASLPGGRHADSIAFGPDGAIWYTDAELNRIGRMTVAEFNQANRPRKPVILSRSLKAKRKRFAKVKIGCPAGPAPCRGKIEIRVRGKLIARGSYQMPVGKKSAGAASFNRLGRKLLGRSRVLKVTVVLKPSNAGKVSRRMKLRR